MKKTIAVATMAASVAFGGLAGSLLGTPTLADAAVTATGAASWVRDALSSLVDDGTITQAQADRVEAALENARPEGPFGHHRFGGHVDLSVVAESLGLSEDELRTAVDDGHTIADVAGEEGVDVQEVIDATVTAQRERLDAGVAEGDLTQEQADELLAGAEERAAALVNGDVLAMPGRPHVAFDERPGRAGAHDGGAMGA